jgi:Fe-S-cluster containining protein
MKDNSKKNKISAGNFSTWLEQTRQAQNTGKGIDVPCGECNACCRSSYFIHITPDEKETIARIPKALLFPAPGLPKGNLVLGYDKNGHCPMFKENKCSIYEHRPQTCRKYDCRVFAASGLFPRDDKKQKIVQHSLRWQFDFQTDYERKQISALRKAARFLKEHADLFPEGFVPRNTTQQAILAIKVYNVFLNKPIKNDLTDEEKNKKLVRAIIDELKRFESVNAENKL